MTTENQKVRLVDIARKAGVSRAAVGHVLNHSGVNNVRVSAETRARVLQIAKSLNYRPNRAAQLLRGKPARLLGVILDTVNMAVFSARLSSIEAEAHRRGYRMMIGQVHHDPSEIQSYLDDFADHGIEGVLCLFDAMRDIRPTLRPIFRGRQSIVIHAAPILKTQPCVRVNTASAITQLVDHLASRGRQRIGLQLWSMSDRLMDVRYRSWLAAMKAQGLAAPSHQVWVNPESGQRPSWEAIDACVEQLVIRQRADAVIASNDEWAVRLIQGLRKRGLDVPRDVAVTGYDNLDIAEAIEPQLTTIDQCHEAYAAAALDLLEASLQRPLTAVDRERVIEPRLIIREST
jgi:DNA-binding LacI/PurR family transcriptional regulator